jgi:hypothetical protein
MSEAGVRTPAILLDYLTKKKLALISSEINEFFLRLIVQENSNLIYANMNYGEIPFLMNSKGHNKKLS